MEKATGEQGDKDEKEGGGSKKLLGAGGKDSVSVSGKGSSGGGVGVGVGKKGVVINESGKASVVNGVAGLELDAEAPPASRGQRAKRLAGTAWRGWRESPKVRDFALYMFFVGVFSFVSFASKPGTIQYYLTSQAQNVYGSSTSSVTDPSSFWSWLSGTYIGSSSSPGLAYPQSDYAGDLLGDVSRLRVLGQGRVMGAMRVRQLRSVREECKVPKWLRAAYGQQQACYAPYTWGNKDKSPFGDRSSLANNTLPFMYQTASAVLVVLVATGNVCELLAGWAAIQSCMSSQKVSWDSPPTPPPPPPFILPPPPPPSSTTPGLMLLDPNVGIPVPALNVSGAVFGGGSGDVRVSVRIVNNGGQPLTWQLDPTAQQYLLTHAWIQITPVSSTASGRSGSTQDLTVTLVRNGLIALNLPSGQPVTSAPLLITGNNGLQVMLTVTANYTAASPPPTPPSLSTTPAPAPSPGSQRRKLLQTQSSSPAPGPSANATNVTTCTEAGDLIVPSALDTNKCTVKCPALPYVGFQTLLQTRAIVIDMTVLQSSFNLFTIVRLVFESPPFGGVFPKAVMRTVRLYRYVSGSDYIVAGFELLFVVLVVYYTIEELIEIKQKGFAGEFSDPWNWLDWANLIIFYVVIGLRVSALVKLNNFDYDNDTIEYIDFPSVAYYATQELNASALNFFLVYFKIFKYLRSVPRMDAILRTLSNAGFDLLLFSIMGSIVLFGFAAAYYVVGFKSFSESCSSLVRFLLGDFAYGDLVASNRYMAPFLFYAYFLTVFFSSQSEEDLLYYARLRERVSSTIARLFTWKRDVGRLATDLDNADANLDNLIDEEELAQVLKDNPGALQILHAPGGVAELLKKYDVTGDGVLDREEMTHILADLAKKEAAIQGHIDDHNKEADNIDVKANSVSGNANKAGALKTRSRAELAANGEGGANNNNNNDMSASQHSGADMGVIEARIDKMEGQVKDMSRAVAKKLSLMIDLMMSLSDQISAANHMLPGAAATSSSSTQQLQHTQQQPHQQLLPMRPPALGTFVNPRPGANINNNINGRSSR
eukprot:jgi/Chlat1/1910/Chrsp149S02222